MNATRDQMINTILYITPEYPIRFTNEIIDPTHGKIVGLDDEGDVMLDDSEKQPIAISSLDDATIMNIWESIEKRKFKKFFSNDEESESVNTEELSALYTKIKEIESQLEVIAFRAARELIDRMRPESDEPRVATFTFSDPPPTELDRDTSIQRVTITVEGQQVLLQFHTGNFSTYEWSELTTLDRYELAREIGDLTILDEYDEGDDEVEDWGEE